MRDFSIYTSNYTGCAQNPYYENCVHVSDLDTLRQALSRDHVCAQYRDNRRSNANFMRSDVIPMDCDNSHSENPADWKTPEDVKTAFPDVCFVVCFSRNHMKEKHGEAARPRFHCYFPVEPIESAAQCSEMKKQLLAQFPWFDGNAVDASRFFFGVAEPHGVFYDGSCTVDQLIPLPTFPEIPAVMSEKHTTSKKRKAPVKERKASTAYTQDDPVATMADRQLLLGCIRSFYPIFDGFGESGRTVDHALSRERVRYGVSGSDELPVKALRNVVRILSGICEVMDVHVTVTQTGLVVE